MFNQGGREAETVQRAHQVQQAAAEWTFTQQEIETGGECICMLTGKAASR